ncbi:MAG: hypothetical protein NTY53_12485 [Kiritimatiellaeota bacterium]|nr:hypothetical protein [Kiritimatiellota bacterium]
MNKKNMAIIGLMADAIAIIIVVGEMYWSQVVEPDVVRFSVNTVLCVAIALALIGAVCGFKAWATGAGKAAAIIGLLWCGLVSAFQIYAHFFFSLKM